MNNVIKTRANGSRQGGIGLKNNLNEGIFTNVIYYTEFADGRKYVGQTTQGFLKRHNDHVKASKPTHYDKVLKAHIDDAVIYPICFGVEDIEDINTQDLLNGLEVAEIMLRETFNDINKKHGLNHTTGGKNNKVSEATKQKLREVKNTSGVDKVAWDKSTKNWRYTYRDENNKRKAIVSKSLKVLEEKVLNKKLSWKIIDEEAYNNTIKQDEKVEIKSINGVNRKYDENGKFYIVKVGVHHSGKHNYAIYRNGKMVKRSLNKEQLEKVCDKLNEGKLTVDEVKSARRLTQLL